MIKVYKDNEGKRRTPEDVGVTWLSPEALAALGWTEVSADYQPPQPAPTKEDKVAAVNAKYDAVYTDIRERTLTAFAVNNQTAVASFQAKYKAAVAAHKAEKEAIVNG